MDRLDGLWVDIREIFIERRECENIIENAEDFKSRMQSLLANLNTSLKDSSDWQCTRRELIQMAALIVQTIEDFNMVRPIEPGDDEMKSAPAGPSGNVESLLSDLEELSQEVGCLHDKARWWLRGVKTGRRLREWPRW